MAVVNDKKAALKKLKLLAYNGKSEVEVFRQKLDDAFKVTFLPNHVECSDYKYGDVQCDILSPEIYSSNRVMLYIHGGSYVGGSRLAYRSFCSSLATKCFCRVVVPEFRLAPSYPYPAANEDIQNVFKSLFTEEQIACSLNAEKGSKPQLPEIIIAADSSGASMAFSLLFNLRERYRTCIKSIILFSPWLDVSAESRILTGKKMSDDIINADVIKKSSLIYTYETNTKNPYISPILADDSLLQNFPPIFIQMGGKEVLLEDAKQFTKHMNEIGNTCVLDVWPDMPFMFQMAQSEFHNSHLAVDRIGIIVTENFAGHKAIQIENKPKLEHSLKSEA